MVVVRITAAISVPEPTDGLQVVAMFVTDIIQVLLFLLNHKVVTREMRELIQLQLQTRIVVHVVAQHSLLHIHQFLVG